MLQRNRRIAPGLLRLSRRRILQGVGLAGAGLGASAAFACGQGHTQSGDTGQPQAGQSSSKAKRGGTINYAGGKLGSFDLQGRTFDPDVQTQSGARSYGLFYDRLLAYDLVSYAVEPDLAQKWEQPSHTEYVFHLQPNVKWQNKPPVNGRLMTTDDVIWSLERARTNDPRFYSRSLLSLVDKIEAPNASTIRLTTKSPDVSTLKKLATDNLAILSREVFDKYPKPITADAAVGTGPFMMNSVEENVAAEYIRNPDYWRSGQPYLDGFRTRNFPDAQTAWAAFLSNQIDIMVLDGTTAKDYISHQGEGFKPNWGPDDTIGNFLFPNVKSKPMDDARVTRALRLLLDHDEWVNTLAATQNGKGGVGGVFPPVLSNWDLTEQEYRQHLEWKQPKDEAAKEALSLLSAAGYSAERPLKFEAISYSNSAGRQGLELMQSEWKRLSQGVVDIDIKLLTTPEIDAARAKRSFTYGQFGTSAGPAEPDVWLGGVYHSGASLNFMGLADPTLDKMIDKQREIFDEKERKAAIRAIVLYLIDHGPSTIGATLYYLHAVQKKVKNYSPETHFINGYQYYRVWLNT